METITIEKCPICKNVHSYNLQVERSYIMKKITLDDTNEPQRKVKVTRTFICPEYGEKQFQASLTLYETSSNEIKSITVIGVKDD